VPLHLLEVMLKFALAVTLEKFRFESFRFVTETDWLGLLLPTAPFPKLRLLEERLTADVPVPERFTAWGLFTASSVNASVPFREPRATGEKVTLTVHVEPAAKLVPHVLLRIAKSPVVAIAVKLSRVFFRFVTLTDFVELVLPIAKDPKFRLFTDSVTGAIPVPVRPTVCELMTGLLSFTVIVPVLEPNAAGEYAMSSVQFAPAASVLGNEAHVPPTWAKSWPRLMLLIVNGVVWAFVMVSVFAALVVPRAWLPKAREAGLNVMGLMPVPVSVTDWGLVFALWTIVSTDVRLPRAKGVNVTLMLQLLPGPSVLGLIGQLPLHE
jgi:hypothetical protein